MAFTTYVAGLKHHQGIRDCGIDEALVLRREPNNPHDSNAIAIYTFEGKQVGYIRKEVAANIASAMDRGELLMGVVKKLKKPGFIDKLWGVEAEMFIEVGSIGHFAKQQNWTSAQQKKLRQFLKEVA